MGMPDHRANWAASEARLDVGGAACRSDQEPYSPWGSNPFGMRGCLSAVAVLCADRAHRPRRRRALVRACHGWSGWASQTQPGSSQSRHVIVIARGY